MRLTPICSTARFMRDRDRLRAGRGVLRRRRPPGRPRRRRAPAACGSPRHPASRQHTKEGEWPVRVLSSRTAEGLGSGRSASSRDACPHPLKEIHEHQRAPRRHAGRAHAAPAGRTSPPASAAPPPPPPPARPRRPRVGAAARRAPRSRASPARGAAGPLPRQADRRRHPRLVPYGIIAGIVGASMITGFTYRSASCSSTTCSSAVVSTPSTSATTPTWSPRAARPIGKMVDEAQGLRPRRGQQPDDGAGRSVATSTSRSGLVAHRPGGRAWFLGFLASLGAVILILVGINGDPVKRQHWFDKFAGGTRS